MSQVTTWFLFCKDAHSNEVVSSTLLGLQSVSEYKERCCADGIKRHLYQMPSYQMASQLFKSQKELNANLHIFKACGNQPPEQWKFETKGKVTLNQIIARSNTFKVGASKKSALRIRAR